jgi:hypothetical protein
MTKFYKTLTLIICLFCISPYSLAEINNRYMDPASAVMAQRQGITNLFSFINRNTVLFPQEKLDKPRLLSQQERTAIVATWGAFAEHLIALETITTNTSDFNSLKGKQRQQDFYLHLSSFLTAYRYSLDFIAVMELDPAIHTLLNEEQAQLGLPKDSYEAFKFHYLNIAIASRFSALEILRKTASSEAPALLKDAISDDSKALWQYGKVEGLKLTALNAKDIVEDSASDVLFPVQTGIANWAGNVRVKRQGIALISAMQIHDMPTVLEPGDILLERREWYLTNVGIPGYWPHAALYIGTAEQRAAFFNDEAVQTWVKSQGTSSGRFEQLLQTSMPSSYQKSTEPEAGHDVRVIEAIAAGVMFTSLEHSAAADSFAALRPRLSKLEKAKALLKAFRYAGRPYDYEFDFITDNSLVCSELVYKAYQPNNDQKGLKFPLSTIAGNLLMPANSIAQTYSEQFGSSQQQMDLVLFLDGDEYKKKSIASSDEAFRSSWTRPKWHIILTQVDDGVSPESP